MIWVSIWDFDNIGILQKKKVKDSTVLAVRMNGVNFSGQTKLTFAVF